MVEPPAAGPDRDVQPRLAAADLERRSGHLRGGHQEHRGVGDVLRRADPAHRHRPRDALACLLAPGDAPILDRGDVAKVPVRDLAPAELVLARRAPLPAAARAIAALCAEVAAVPARWSDEFRDPPRSQCTPDEQGRGVSATVLYMSMSLDGFIAGPNEGPGNGLGDGGERLHDWVFAGAGDAREPGPGRPPGVNGQIVDEFMATGAVVAGRGTFEPAGGWGGDHHDGVPIFVLSRQGLPADAGRWPLVTYVDDVRTAMAGAKRAADGKDVLVHGAAVAQLALAAGVLDELELSVVPVLLGQGRRLFDHLAPEPVELERTRILEGEGGVTHLHHRVRR